MQVVDELGGVTLTYVLDRISMPVPSESIGRAVGFDLDERSTRTDGGYPPPTCEHLFDDYQSALEGFSGVDNSFSTATSGLFEAAIWFGPQRGAGRPPPDRNQVLRDEISNGRLLVLLEVRGVNSLENDPEIEARLMLGRLPEGERLRFHGDGPFLRGQAFEIDRMLSPAAEGDIFRRRLRVQWEQVELPVAAEGFVRDIHGVEMRAQLCAEGVYRAHLGGAVTVADTIAELNAIFPGFGGSLAVSASADLWPSEEGPDFCDAFSVGYELEGSIARRR